MKGIFITFEGCEGSGKSTQLQATSEWLTSLGIDNITTREPGGSPVAEELRTLVLRGDDDGMTPECEALLHTAARMQHIHDTITPALGAGKWVLCDRYVDSSIAYQGFGRGMGARYIRELNSEVYEKYMPDLTLFFDITPEEAFKRKHGPDKNDRMEKENIAFHNKVYWGFRWLVGTDYPRIRTVPCGGTKEETQAAIQSILGETVLAGIGGQNGSDAL